MSVFAEREKIQEGKKAGDDFRKAGLEYSEKAKKSLAEGNANDAKIYERLAAIKRSAAKLADEGAWKKISWDEYYRIQKDLSSHTVKKHHKDKASKKPSDKAPHKEHAKKIDSKAAGYLVGSVVSISKGKITVKNGEKTMTLMPHWNGGHPSDGGGFDKAILKQLSQIKAGDIVKIKWEHSEHNRILAIQKL